MVCTMVDDTRVVNWYDDIETHLSEIFGGNLHAKRIGSLADATLGVIAGATLAVSLIGLSLAEAKGLTTKHAVKQVDRLMSNKGIDPWKLFAYWVPEQVGTRKEIVVAIDWTDYDGDGQATLSLNLVTSHGRATPLLWLSMWKDELKGNRNDCEDSCLRRLAEVLPYGTKVTLLADRGFGDYKLFEFVEKIGFGFVIRFRGNIHVTAADGETRFAADWVGKGGRARKLRGAQVTTAQAQVGSVVCVQAKAMKEAWCLATSDAEASAKEVSDLYARRWTIEPTFRDTKDLRFGMGLDKTHISEPERRDRLLLLSALAISLLTMLGTAGESLGMDRLLKVNTVKRRTHSLFRQGCMLYGLIPKMPEFRLVPLMKRFDEVLQQNRVFSDAFAACKK